MKGEVRRLEASKASMIKNKNAQNLASTECGLRPGKVRMVLTKTGNKRGDTGMEEKMLVGTSKGLNPIGFPVRHGNVEARRA